MTRAVALSALICVLGCGGSDSKDHHDTSCAPNCTTTELTSSGLMDSLLAMDDTRLYGLDATQKQIVYLPKSGGDAQVLYTTSSEASRPISAIAVKGSSVLACVIHSSILDVLTIDATTGGASILTTFDVGIRPTRCDALAAAGDHVYAEVATLNGVGEPSDTTSIYEIPAIGGAPTLLDAQADEDTMFADDDGAYYVVYNNDPSLLGEGENIASIAPGGTRQNVGPAFQKSFGAGFTLGGGMLVAIDGYSLIVLTTGGDSVSEFNNVGQVSGVATDGEDVFWSFSQNTSSAPTRDASIWTAPAQGGTPLQLTTEQSRVSDLLVDDTHVYFLRVVGATRSVASFSR